MKKHHYSTTVKWTGNNGRGTADYRAYERSHTIMAPHKPDIQGSSDKVFRGDPTKHNPEELLVASLSACHMLAYLHLCAVHGVVVEAYEDEAQGTLELTPEGGGHFREVTLHPIVTVASETMVQPAKELHEQAHRQCFIASSVNFPVKTVPICKVQTDKRVKFDFEVTFSNGGSLAGTDFRLDISGDDITDEELGDYLVRDMNLLMVQETRIINKAIIEEKHKRNQTSASRE